MKASAEELLKLLPGPATDKWPEGLPFTQALAHGTMSVELFRPIGADHQQPHEQDDNAYHARLEMYCSYQRACPIDSKIFLLTL
jgi:hypothetical protein